MCEDKGIVINSFLSIPFAELDFRFAKSGGPGGQHVNKTETKVILRFDLVHSPSLSDWIRGRLLERLSKRLDKEGIIQIVSQGSRSQKKNKEEAISRFQKLLSNALTVQKKRRATRPSRGAKERRLDGKKKQGQRKRERSQKWTE